MFGMILKSINLSVTHRFLWKNIVARLLEELDAVELWDIYPNELCGMEPSNEQRCTSCVVEWKLAAFYSAQGTDAIFADCQ